MDKLWYIQMINITQYEKEMSYQATNKHEQTLHTYYLNKKPFWKGYLVYDFNCSWKGNWKRQNYRDSKKISSFEWLRVEERGE